MERGGIKINKTISTLRQSGKGNKNTQTLLLFKTGYKGNKISYRVLVGE